MNGLLSDTVEFNEFNISWRMLSGNNNNNHSNPISKYKPPQNMNSAKPSNTSKKCDKQSHLNFNNSAHFSSALVPKTCLKLSDLNEFYNINYHLINSSHPFYQTILLLSGEIPTLNLNIYEMNTSEINSSINEDMNLDELKLDFISELLPSIHNINKNKCNESKHSEDDMINFPRYTMFDHIHCISHLCHLNDILDGFLIQAQPIHPTRMRDYNKYSDEYSDDEYDEDNKFEGDENNANNTSIEVYNDQNDNSNPLQIARVKRYYTQTKYKKQTKQLQSLPMDESELNELHMNRLRKIYAMDLSKYRAYGMDINVMTQLQTVLSPHTLHSSFITSNKNTNNEIINESNNVNIEHNKGILLHGPSGTDDTFGKEGKACIISKCSLSKWNRN